MHTRCPHCSTTFSITHQHLEVANGQVRCGSCDQAFNGRDNVVDAQGNLIRKPKEEKTSEFETGDDIFGLLGEASEEDLEDILGSSKRTDNKDSADESWADALLAEEGANLEPESSAPPPVIEATVTKKSQSIVSEPVKAPDKPKPVTSAKKTVTKPGSTKQSTRQKPKTSSSQFSKEFLNISSGSKNNPFRDSDHSIQHSTDIVSEKTKDPSSKPVKDRVNDTFSEDIFDDQDLMDELAELDQTDSNQVATKEKLPFEETFSDKQSLDDGDELEKLEKLINQQKPEPEQKDPAEKTAPSTPVETDDKSSIISELEEIAVELDSKTIQPTTSEVSAKAVKEKPDDSEKSNPAKDKKPLFQLKFNSDELDEIKAPSPPPKNRKVFALNAVLTSLFTLLLAFQFAYFNMDQFARDPKYRPYYEMACEKLSCKVPTLQNLNKIRGSHLVVREHPDFKKALLIDVILTNHASYPQLFPIMELIFTDSENKPVRQRQFKPSEYLMGELAKLETMPPDVPIHISLELVDPGSKARGWEINFLSYLH